MSARLTLLLLCDQTELNSQFISALLATGFHLLIEHHPEDAKRLLSRAPLDAIMIRHDAVRNGSLVGAELKVVAPRTPIILFPGDTNCRGPQLGIDSICHADVRDETLARAIAVFFHSALSSQPPNRLLRPRGDNVQVPAPESKTQLTL
jgi:hypothetical protein